MKAHRKPAVAGMFYPNNPDRLTRDVETYISASSTSAKDIVKFIIAPHAGYMYSGKIAGEAFAELKNHPYQKVIILGPSHRYSFKGLAESEESLWQLPNGNAKIESVNHAVVDRVSQYHQSEHCLEVQMPFLIHLMPDASFSPILVSASYHQAERLADVLAEIDDDDTLWVISSDFNHVGPNFRHFPDRFGYASGEAMDMEAIDYITAGDIDKFIGFLEQTHATICGAVPILTAMHLIKRLNRPNFQFKKYDCSGKQTGDVNSVGYAALFS